MDALLASPRILIPRCPSQPGASLHPDAATPGWHSSCAIAPAHARGAGGAAALWQPSRHGSGSGDSAGRNVGVLR